MFKLIHFHLTVQGFPHGLASQEFRQGNAFSYVCQQIFTLNHFDLTIQGFPPGVAGKRAIDAHLKDLVVLVMVLLKKQT